MIERARPVGAQLPPHSASLSTICEGGARGFLPFVAIAVYSQGDPGYNVYRICLSASHSVSVALITHSAAPEIRTIGAGRLDAATAVSTSSVRHTSFASLVDRTPQHRWPLLRPHLRGPCSIREQHHQCDTCLTQPLFFAHFLLLSAAAIDPPNCSHSYPRMPIKHIHRFANLGLYHPTC